MKLKNLNMVIQKASHPKVSMGQISIFRQLGIVDVHMSENNVVIHSD